MSQEPTTHWENEELSFKTYDHPEANGRKAVIGEQEHTLKFPLDDKRMLTIRMGRIGFESLTDMLMKMLADAPSENDDNPAAPAIFAKLRQELASARTAAEQAQRAKQELADKTLFVFDVESIGLHGEGFSVGWVVVKNGAEFEASYLACDRALAKGADADRAWVEKNVPAQPTTHSSPLAVRDAFWRVWRQWQANEAVMIADCSWPVEARFLAQCVDDAPSERSWDGPYPLHDAASLLLAFGKDPLATNERLDSEKPAHNPLCDARQTARLINEASRDHAAQGLPSAIRGGEKEA